MSKKVYVVTKGIYSDYTIVAIKSNKEAAERLMKKCSNCNGTGIAYDYKCWDCEHCDEITLNWNQPLEMEVEDE